VELVGVVVVLEEVEVEEPWLLVVEEVVKVGLVAASFQRQREGSLQVVVLLVVVPLGEVEVQQEVERRHSLLLVVAQLEEVPVVVALEVAFRRQLEEVPVVVALMVVLPLVAFLLLATPQASI
jgi:hypothetical protein